MVAPRREEPLQQRGGTRVTQQLAAGQLPSRSGVPQREGGAPVRRPVQGPVAVQQRGVVLPGQPGPQLTEIRPAGTADDAGRQREAPRSLDPDALARHEDPATVHPRHGDARVAEFAARIAHPQCQVGAVRGQHRGAPDRQPRGGARQDVVQDDVGGQPRVGDVLHDHVVGPRHEDTAAPRLVRRGHLTRGEVDLAPVPGHRLVEPAGAAHPGTERRVEGLHPHQGASRAEVLGGFRVPGQERVLEPPEPVGELRCPEILTAVGPHQGVVVDDHLVVGRIAVHHCSMTAVAAEEGILPADGGAGLPRAVDHAETSLSTATP